VLADGFDAGMLVIDYPPEGATGREEYDPSVDALIAATRATGTQGMVVSTLPELLPEAVRDRLVARRAGSAAGAGGGARRLRRAAGLARRWTAADALPAVLPAAAAGGERSPARRMAEQAAARRPWARRAEGRWRPRRKRRGGAGDRLPGRRQDRPAGHRPQDRAGAVALDLRNEAALAAALSRIAATSAEPCPAWSSSSC